MAIIGNIPYFQTNPHFFKDSLTRRNSWPTPKSRAFFATESGEYPCKDQSTCGFIVLSRYPAKKIDGLMEEIHRHPDIFRNLQKILALTLTLTLFFKPLFPLFQKRSPPSRAPRSGAITGNGSSSRSSSVAQEQRSAPRRSEKVRSRPPSWWWFPQKPPQRNLPHLRKQRLCWEILQMKTEVMESVWDFLSRQRVNFNSLHSFCCQVPRLFHLTNRV